MTPTVIQLPDHIKTDPTVVRLLAFDGAVLPASGFLGIDCPASERKFFAQVAAPQLNLNRDGLGPDDITTVNQMERLLTGKLNRSVVVKESFFYQAILLRDVTGPVPASVRRRPQIGSLGRLATDEEVVRWLGLPAYKPELFLGHLIDSTVPICISENTLRKHALFAGATGSGKSNTLANYIAAALALGWC